MTTDVISLRTWKEARLVEEETGIEWIEYSVRDEHLAVANEGVTGVFAIYPAFLTITSLIAAFFAVSLGLALTSQYFLNWGTALLGFIGTIGLIAVGWFSMRQARSYK